MDLKNDFEMLTNFFDNMSTHFQFFHTCRYIGFVCFFYPDNC